MEELTEIEEHIVDLDVGQKSEGITQKESFFFLVGKLYSDKSWKPFYLIEVMKKAWKSRNSIDFVVLSDSLRHIDGMVNDGNDRWRLTGIYGWPKDAQKNLTWNLMRDLASSSESKWLCVGDFNEILF
ncbi:hypothetical protein DH2020_009186 [Rehmannia glutinosa]|uniref:Endonuclease/exonuclease/phosphatase domain-containing protein n=1 Tax=Rehmannia glutinosa TaxID=99300 RepID=A0ABR0X6F5_REHGL